MVDTAGVDEIPQALQTIAEVGIGFAGFSGLVVAFRKNTGPLTRVQKYRLQVLLAMSLGAMFLSFLPETLLTLPITAPRVWVASSTVVMAYSMAFLAWWVVRSRRMMRAAPEIFDRFAFSRMALGHTLVILMQAAVIVGWFADSRAGVYLVALIWYLLHAAQQFGRMLFVQPGMGNYEADR